MNKCIETITMEQGKTATLMSNEDLEIKAEYDIVSDTTNDEGIRTITIKPSSRNSIFLNKRKELIEELLNRLGEKSDGNFAMLLENVINQYGFDLVEEFHKKVVTQKEPVRAQKGCFEIVIGKGKGRAGNIGIR